MAKYSDYVKDDQLDKEIADSQAKRKEIPESVLKRFDGKSLDDVLEAYTNLERLNSRQGEEMGNLRKQVDALVELQLQGHIANTSQDDGSDGPDDPITLDDLYEAPEDAIQRVAKKTSQETNKRVEQLEEALVELDRKEKLLALNSKYTNWMDEVQSEPFLEWVKGSSYRTRLALDANNYDFDAANDLLGMWYDHKDIEQTVEKRQKREQDLRNATLESSSPPGVQVPETYSRSELLEKRIAAKRGDQKAERWLQAHADSIAVAYEEGRISN
jgi:hypothetical protein